MWSIAFWNASWWLLLASAKNALYLSAPAPLTRPPLRELSFVLSALSSRLGTRCSSISASPFVVTRSYTCPPPCCHQAKPNTSADGLFTGVARRLVVRSSHSRSSRKFRLLSTPPVLSPDGPPKLGSGHGAQPSQRRCPSALVSLPRAPYCPSRSGPHLCPRPKPRSPEPPPPS